jgi:type VI secretion system protein ImpH
VATTPRQANTPLEEQLLRRGHEFSFFQAMRLLLMIGDDSAASQTVRVRPELELSFPPADLNRVEKGPGCYTVGATFLGLYGPASPLPTFYSEELLADAAADLSATKGFLDVLNHLIFDLFHQSTLKYRLFFQIAQLEQEEYLDRLFCLIGLGDKRMRRQLEEPQSLLRYAGLFSLQQRSSLGLATFLSDFLQLPVEVVQCVPRRAQVPAEQRLRVGIAGCTVGADAVVGCEVVDRTGKFLLRVGPLKNEEFAAYLPGTPGRDHLDALVRFFLREPMAWDLELIRVTGEGPAAMLGGETAARLGWDSLLPSADTLVQPSVIFPGISITTI